MALPNPSRHPSNDHAGKQGDEEEQGKRRLERQRHLLIDERIGDKCHGMAICDPEGDQQAANDKKNEDIEEAFHGCLGKKPVAREN
jgi:hypothetical protein